MISPRPSKPFETPLASKTNLPDVPPVSACRAAVSLRTKAAWPLRASRMSIKRRKRPSLRVRLAVTPRASQRASSSSVLSSFSNALRSCSSMLAAQASNLEKGASKRRTTPLRSHKHDVEMADKNARSWLTTSTAPENCFNRRSSSSIAAMSRWLVGSSNINRSGSAANARARDARRASPPDIPATARSGDRPKLCSSAAAAAKRAASSRSWGTS